MTQPTIEQMKTAEAFLDEMEEASLSHGSAIDLDNRLEEIVVLRSCLRAALTEKVLPEWQPIETAPKDRRVLVWTGQNIYVAKWVKNILTNHEAFMLCETGVPGERIIIVATHWKECPAQPAHTAAKDGAS